MTETYPTDAQLAELSGASDPEQEVLFIPIGQSPYYTSFYKMLWRLMDVCRRAGDLRVYRDGELTFGVRAGRFLTGDAEVVYAGSAGNALTNNDVNYVYLTADGTLTVNTSGFPAPSAQPHVPLAEITTAAGSYSPSAGDLLDCRGGAMFTPVGYHAPDLVCEMSGTDGADGTGTMAIQIADRAGNDIADRFKVHTWIADADMSEPDAQTDFSVSTGEQLYETEADADYTVISDATGLVEMDIDAGGAKTVFVMACIDGRIFSAQLDITD
jgi:hypothetical protein